MRANFFYNLLPDVVVENETDTGCQPQPVQTINEVPEQEGASAKAGLKKVRSATRCGLPL